MTKPALKTAVVSTVSTTGEIIDRIIDAGTFVCENLSFPLSLEMTEVYVLMTHPSTLY